MYLIYRDLWMVYWVFLYNLAKKYKMFTFDVLINYIEMDVKFIRKIIGEVT